MQVTLNLPEDIGHELEARFQDLPRAALESLALEAYRSGALTEFQVQRLLGFQTRLEVDGFLKSHGVYLNYTLEDLDRDTETSRRSVADDRHCRHVTAELSDSDRRS